MGRYLSNLRGRGRLLAASLIVAIAIGAAGSAFGATAGATRVVTLGSTATRPSCPSLPCQAVGKVTGFQSTIGSRKNVFVAPFSGKIVSWSIRLSRPATSGKSPTQNGFFNSFYGSPARAHIQILRRKGTGSPPAYTLMRESPLETLTSYFGQRITFALAKPLSVNKGGIVALGIPTWAPAFAVNISNSNSWRASRRAHHCDKVADIQNGAAHGGVGKTRSYGCLYKGARLVYSAVLAN